MKQFKNMAAQGDVLIIKIDTIPKNTEKEEVVNNEYIVTHSETGHHHVMDAEKSIMYKHESNPFICYLSVSEPTALIHKRAFDTHEPILFDKGVYEIRRQREHSLEGWRRVQD